MRLFGLLTLNSVLCGILAGCVNQVRIEEPTSVRPQPEVARPAAVTGGIYQSGAFRPLFEDRRARFQGDTLLITISEKTSASNTTSNNASRTASADVSLPTIRRLPARGLQGMSLEADTQTKFEDKDQAKNDNLFSGTITVTVIDVLPNGNLLVSGEKQVGVNGEVDTLRFSGVVNPRTIQTGNTVPSSQVADARIETVSRSSVDAARVAGFLGRFFLSFIPFR